MNTAQKTILIAGISILLCLALFPPWQQAAEKETDYRKDLGRGFAFRPPSPVAVDCYLVGCQKAPASYFHVLLYRDLFGEQLTTVVGVALVLLWMFRSRRDGTRASLESSGTRLRFSMIMALLVPLEGTFPTASYLVDLPRQVIHRDELWLIPAIMVIVIFVICVFALYLVTSAAVRVFDGLTHGPKIEAPGAPGSRG